MLALTLPSIHLRNLPLNPQSPPDPSPSAGLEVRALLALPSAQGPEEAGSFGSSIWGSMGRNRWHRLGTQPIRWWLWLEVAGLRSSRANADATTPSGGLVEAGSKESCHWLSRQAGPVAS